MITAQVGGERRVRRRLCSAIASRTAAVPAAAWRRFAATAGRYRDPEVHLPFSTEKSKQVYERTLGVLIEASSSSSQMRPNALLA